MTMEGPEPTHFDFPWLDFHRPETTMNRTLEHYSWPKSQAKSSIGYSLAGLDELGQLRTDQIGVKLEGQSESPAPK